jgi:hypothetical protein
MKLFTCLSLALALSATAYAKPPCKKPAQGNHNNHDSSDSNSESNSNSSSKSDVSNSGNSSSVSKGGNATGGSATLSNAGNSYSSNVNNNTTQGGAGGAGGAGGQGGAGGNSTAQGGAGGSSQANNSLAGTISNNQVYQQVRQAPAAYAPDALPSAPCRVSGSAGASSPFGGVSIGGSKLDTECDRRETARAFALLGNKLAAARILCNSKAAKEAQLTFQECANYEEGYFGGKQDGDSPQFTVPAGTGTPKR